MRRRRALWRATHRGSKEMDFLLGRYAEQTLDGMNATDIAAFERLIETPDPGDRELRARRLFARRARPRRTDASGCRRFHGLEPSSTDPSEI